MATLTDFYPTNDVDDVLDEWVRVLIASSLRAEYNNSESLSATRNLVDADTPLQRFDCNGANRIVRLPSGSTTTNHLFLIKNETASGSYTLSVETSGGATNICTLLKGEYALIVPDGSGSWVLVNRIFSRDMTAGQITSNQNNYSPTGAEYNDVIRISSDAARDITGLGFSAKAKTVVLINNGSYTITLKNESASSTAANRFSIGSDFSFEAGKAVLVYYDDGASRWRMIGGGGGSSTTPDTTEYRLSVSVSANDLIIALKDKDGNDPSSASPVKIKIGNAVRSVTSALSVTIPDGTNWYNMGSSELATKEVDLFVNAVWDSNSSAVALAPSRVPWNGNVSDYSATTTDEKHLYGHSGYTSTDPVQVIGRVAATLSAGAGYTWTIPTLDDDNLIHRPINETRWLDWVPTRTGYSSIPTSIVYQYKLVNDTVYIIGRDGADGTSNATSNHLTVPFTALSTTNIVYQFITAHTNNSVNETTPGYAYLSSTSPSWSTIGCSRDMAGSLTGWTASGSKRIRSIIGFYKIK